RPELDFLNVRFLVAEPDAAASEKWKLIYRGKDGALFENARFKARFTPASEIREVSPGDFTMRVHGPAHVVSSEPAGPGWRLRIDGRAASLHTVEGAFLAFDVPLGDRLIHLRYQPLSYYGSLVVALIAALGLIVWNTWV